MALYHWNVMCLIEGNWIPDQSVATPTVCPNNGVHTIGMVRKRDLVQGAANTVMYSDGTETVYGIVDNTLVANMPANTIKMNDTNSAAKPTDVTIARGELITRDGTSIIKLTPGTSGTVLTSQGVGADLTWSSPGALPSNFQTAEDTSDRSTTSTTFQQLQRLTTPSLPAGTYCIEVHAIWKFSSTQNSIRFRCQVDNTTTLWGNEFVEIEPKDGTSTQRHPLHLSDYYTGSGVLDIDLDFSRVGVSGTADVYWTRITIWRVA